MYFHTKTTPSGKVLQLLESYRNRKGQSRNRVVLSLGNAAIPEEDQHLIAKAVEKHLYGQQELFSWNYSENMQKWIDRIVRQVDLQGRWQPFKPVDGSEEGKTVDGVFLEEIDHENTAMLGAVLLGSHAWKQLEMDDCLESLGFNPSQRLAAIANIINRLVDPVSEHALPAWIRRSALPELFGEKILRVRKDKFYRVTDKLLAKRKQIESHIRRQHRELFSLKRTLLLYDLTNTFFEGTAEKNPKAKRGHSKHKRNDCPQIVLGMVFDENGFELGHEIFEGNRSDSTTLVEMIKKLQEFVAEEANLFELEKPLVIIDSGVATKANRKLLRCEGFSYLVNESRPGRKAFRDKFLEDEKFRLIQGRKKKGAVKIRVIEASIDSQDEETDRLVLCKSAGRRKKENAIRSCAEERFLEALGRLASRVEKGRLKDEVKIERAIGRIQEKHTRVNRFYKVEVEKQKNIEGTGAIHRVTWKLKDEEYQGDDELLGCYVLRTDRKSFSGEELWRLYMMLTRAEDGFRSLKSHLGLRPIRHHIENRTDAHIFISVLAYHLLRSILYPLETKGDMRNWETLKRVLSTHCYTTIIVPTKKSDTYRIRKAGRPDTMQKAIYKSLRVDWKNLPKKIVKT